MGIKHHNNLAWEDVEGLCDYRPALSPLVDLSLIFVQLDLKNFWKILKDPLIILREYDGRYIWNVVKWHLWKQLCSPKYSISCNEIFMRCFKINVLLFYKKNVTQIVYISDVTWSKFTMQKMTQKVDFEVQPWF